MRECRASSRAPVLARCAARKRRRVSVDSRQRWPRAERLCVLERGNRPGALTAGRCAARGCQSLPRDDHRVGKRRRRTRANAAADARMVVCVLRHGWSVRHSRVAMRGMRHPVRVRAVAGVADVRHRERRVLRVYAHTRRRQTAVRQRVFPRRDGEPQREQSADQTRAPVVPHTSANVGGGPWLRHSVRGRRYYNYRMLTRAQSRAGFAAAALMLLAACGPNPRTTVSIANPGDTALAVRAPDTVRVRFETTKGPFVVEAYRAWAPRGVDRFYQLARIGYFDGVRFFRVISGFMAQFGIHGDPSVSTAWHDRTIPDDSVTQSNRRGTITFATRGPNSRTTQLFINLVDNQKLDRRGFAPIGVITSGMNVVDSLYSGYGEGAPMGSGPYQPLITAQGNAYLQRDFPRLDYIVRTELLTAPRPR